MRNLFLSLVLFATMFAFAQGNYDELTGIEWEKDSVYLWSKDTTYTFPVTANAFGVSLSVRDYNASVSLRNKSDKPIEVNWNGFLFYVNEKWDATKVDYVGEKYEKVYKNESVTHAFSRSFGARTTKLLGLSDFEKIRKKTKNPVDVKVEVYVNVIYNEESFMVRYAKYGKYVGKRK